MDSTNKEKIAIIGAGIIGLYLAWKLQEKGFEITVFEKKDRVGLKPCTSLISERIRNFLPIENNFIQRKIDSVLVHFPKKDIRLKTRPSFLLFERKDLDEFVYNLAKNAGARFIFQKEISQVPEGFTKVIGCDGALSNMRKLVCPDRPKFRLGLQYFFNQDIASPEVEIWPKIFKSSPKYGFFWSVPRKNNQEFGAIGPADILKQELEKFCKQKKISLDEEIIKAALIPEKIYLPDSDNIALVGDAAGLTKPTSGGGIIWGLTAADMLIKHFPDFRSYKKEAERFFQPKTLKGKLAVSLGYFLGEYLPFLLPDHITIDADLF